MITFRVLLNKKAAMFGLDARIALVIFIALSAIVGTSLYQIILRLEVTKILSELNAVAKAEEQRYIDTLKEIPVAHANYWLNANLLIEDTTSGWKGPYIYKSKLNTEHPFCFPGYFESMCLLRAKKDKWNAHFNYWDTANNCVKGQNNCYLWISAVLEGSSDNFDLARRLDKRLDKNDSPLSGEFRYVKDGRLNIFLLSRPYNFK